MWIIDLSMFSLYDPSGFRSSHSATYLNAAIVFETKTILFNGIYCLYCCFLLIFNYFSLFIDNGRAQKKGVLVHCLAGISRSVTVMLAYLMAHRQLTLNEAYNMVLKRKANIDPNFHFMQQLHSFEKQMLDARTQTKQLANSTGSSASSYLSPLSTTVQSPDSGIEFDRWTPGTGG